MSNTEIAKTLFIKACLSKIIKRNNYFEEFYRQQKTGIEFLNGINHFN